MHIHTTHKYPIYNMQIIIKKIIINNKWLLRNCDKDLYRVGHFTVDKLLSSALTVQPFLLLIRQQIFVKSWSEQIISAMAMHPMFFQQNHLN